MSALPSPVPLLSARGIAMRYGRGKTAHTALEPTDLNIFPGESVAIVGHSGAGKSTLAEIILGLRKPSAGTIYLNNELFVSPKQLPPRKLRRKVQGIAQDAAASLPPRTSVRVTCQRAMRRLVHGQDTSSWLTEAATGAHLDAELLDCLPAQLSGGQGQRAAITRALTVKPVLIVADEPTSALDTQAALVVSDTLLNLTRNTERSLVVITHDDRLAARCDRLLCLEHGRIAQGDALTPAQKID